MVAKIRPYLSIILILLLAALLRFVWLDKVPNAVGGDELTYIVNARSLFLTGTDISGTWNPMSGFVFKYPLYTTPQAELPYFLLAPFVGIFGFSLFWVRVPFVLSSIGSVYLIYLITRQLFGKRAGLFASFITAINPWSIYIARTSYESSPAIFFFLLAFYMLLSFKGRKIFWTIPIFFLAFYSYIATKVAFLPFIFGTTLFSYFYTKKKYLREYLIVFGVCLILVIFFFISVSTTKGPTRAGDLISFNSTQFATQVDQIRKVSIQSPLSQIFENKFTFFARLLITKFFKSISFEYLFLTGDQFFSLLRHGFFYILDALFLVFGLAFAYSKKKSAFFLLFFLTAVGILPQVFHATAGEDISIHLALMFAILPIFIGVGIDGIASLFNNKRYFYASTAAILIAYLLLVLNFANIYFFQFPLNGYFDFKLRLMSKYAQLAIVEKKPITVFSSAVPDTFKKYIFYTNSLEKGDILTIRKIYRSEKFSFKGVTFSSCNRDINPKDIKGTLVYDTNCGDLSVKLPRIVIPRLSDGGQSYQIYNDEVCSKYNLKGYPANLKISDFNIEKMGEREFCQTFITNP